MNLIYDSDYRIVYGNFPPTVKAFVVQSEDGFYTIFVNARHSYFVQQEAIEHELKHISGRDFQKFNVSDIEFGV